MVRRLRLLQPYRRPDTENHPIRVLAEHNNLAKHRTPAVAAGRLGAFKLDAPEPDVTIMDGGPIQVGDTLATMPFGKKVAAPVCLRCRSGDRIPAAWHIVMKELGWLEEWVRTTAVPHLIAGTRDVGPLPPGLDTTVGHDDLRSALSAASQKSAFQRSERRIQAVIARQGLIDTLAGHPLQVNPQVIRAWLDGLDDDAVILVAARLHTDGDLEKLDRVARAMLAETVAAHNGNC